MGWEANKESFIKMMQVNEELFGKEIQLIESASEKYLVGYFENALFNMLDPYVAINSEYSVKEYGGKGDIESVHLIKEGFGLDMNRCIKIFDYIIGRCAKKHHAYKQLHWTDSIIVLNFIQRGYELNDCFNGYVLCYRKTGEFFSI